ncbi:tyrosine-protein phosphatase non-receptor type 12-like isoform X2 [Ruditapes philippinarum]|uniref:tyrosine-protein phosphatase non-receptor type 12-like isoform X2 n=1 Tax=Ruditapes philippinarum TaxID=129788 RepID=UPI00295BEC22|nr:tyrosine-protein phosphatase non-receptor type 12-like isoform X2 [Ruditapes philippinarum]
MEIDDSESTLRLQKCLQTFIFHVDDLIHEDDPSGDGFTREFKVIRDEGIKMREENTYPAEEGRRPCNIKKNRYKDILPFDQTRVTLTEIPGEDGSDYINANFIQDQYGAKCYIASQGPVQTTVYDFWRMIIQYKVKVIAMACKLIEMGKRKCEQYWPDMEEDVEEYRDITVTLVSTEDIADHLTKRVMRAVRAGHGSVTVTQFHYIGWPDHDIPNDFDVILEMMAEMREIKSQDTEKAPMVIHCSAGCGRTGTICAIDFAWDLLKSGNMDEAFSLCEIVRIMRTQRQSMIQAPEQYMMAHVTIQTLFQKHLDLMEDHTYGNIGFGDNSDEDSGKLDGSVSEAGSDLSGLHDGTRKRSVMEQDIANTIKKVTHVQTADELLNQTNATGSVPVGLPEPLKPTLAVYVAEETPEHVTSPKINELKKTFSNENKTYKVEKIEMPNKPATKIEERYLENLHKVEKSEKKMSFVSNEARQKDIESKRALYDKPKISEKPALEPQKSMDKTTSVIASSVKEQNNNQLTNDSKVNNERPLVQRVESQIQTGNKYVTVLSVGGVQDKKPTLSKTTSAPGPPINTPPQSFTQRSKTLSVKKSKIVEEKPQSSIPPESPAAQTGSMYSMAGNSQFYSSLSNYSSAVPEGTKNHVPNNKLSDSPAYSYAKATYDPYSAVDENPGDVHLSKPKVEASTIQNTQVYSYATEPVNPANNIYAGIDKQMKPVGNRKSHEVDATYEAVTIGSTSDQMAPALPNRGYLEDGENQNIDKSVPKVFRSGGRAIFLKFENSVEVKSLQEKV